MHLEEWRNWKLDHAGLTWRAARPEDSNVIQSLFESFDQKYGKQDRPDLFAMPVVLTLVAEDFEGRIVDAFYIELIADITKLTTHRAGFDAIGTLTPVIGSFLAERKVRVAQMTVPVRWSEQMAVKLLGVGFRMTDGRFRHWIRKVLP